MVPGFGTEECGGGKWLTRKNCPEFWLSVVSPFWQSEFNQIKQCKLSKASLFVRSFRKRTDDKITKNISDILRRLKTIRF